MTQEREWQKWRRQESDILSESIAFAARIFGTTDEWIDSSRWYGTALLAESVECARAIRLCIDRGLPSPAFALARAQYEGALRGHIIIHEIELEVLNIFMGLTRSWQQDKQIKMGPPMIEIRKNRWRIVTLKKRHAWLPLQNNIAKLFVGWIGNNMGLLHDLAHSGMTHALLMRGEDGNIEPNYSDQNQTLLLNFADRVVMFSIMIWPGADQMYRREIEQRMERTTQLRSQWDGIIPA